MPAERKTMKMWCPNCGSVCDAELEESEESDGVQVLKGCFTLFRALISGISHLFSFASGPPTGVYTWRCPRCGYIIEQNEA